jgi:hypothetical protein
MSSLDRREKTGQGDFSLNWRLKSWVDRRLAPEGGRERLLRAAGAPPKAWRSIWKKVYISFIRPLLPHRAGSPFSAEDLISSVTMFSHLHSGIFICT